MQEVEQASLDEASVEKRSRVAVVVLGRGVELRDRYLKDVWGGRSGVVGVINEVEWDRGRSIKPTRLVEAAEVRKPELGMFGPEQHPVFDSLGENDDNDVRNLPNARYAGANANVLAAIDLTEEILADSGKELVGVLWAAGRTPDMEAYAPEGMTQGEVLARKYCRRMRRKLEGHDVTMVFEPENVNTWDDLTNSLKWAEGHGIEEVKMVTVRPHIARTEDMVGELLGQMENEGMGIPQVEFVVSEDRLVERNKRFRPIIELAQDSVAGYATLARECKGLADRRLGSYESQWADGGRSIRGFDKPVVEKTPEEVLLEEGIVFVPMQRLEFNGNGFSGPEVSKEKRGVFNGAVVAVNTEGTRVAHAEHGDLYGYERDRFGFSDVDRGEEVEVRYGEVTLVEDEKEGQTWVMYIPGGTRDRVRCMTLREYSELTFMEDMLQFAYR